MDGDVTLLASSEALLVHIRQADLGYPKPGVTLRELVRKVENEAFAKGRERGYAEGFEDGRAGGCCG